jgi:Zn-dependent protease with chaperone function
MKHYQLLKAILLAAGVCTMTVPAQGIAWAASREAAPAKTEGEPTTRANAYLPTESELKLGREGAAEAEKQYKILREGDQVKRVQAIAEEVLRAAYDPQLLNAYLVKNKLPHPRDNARRVAFAFSFKVADSKEVNAFSFAGGPVYVTTGLLDYVQSDHELAAVLAHEIAHVMHHHLVALIQKQSKAEQKMMWALLAGLLSGAAASPDFSNVLLGAQLYNIAKQNGYGRDAERDADKTGVEYLTRTRFNPVGMLTVMKRFARDEARRSVELGIFQSHPYAKERAELVTGYLKSAGIRVESGIEREISRSFRLETRPVAGKEATELLLNGELMFRAAPLEGKSSVDRVRAVEKRLSDLLDQNLTLRDLRLSSDQTQILALGQPFLTATTADAEVNQLSVPQTTKRALDVLLKALWKEQLDATF